MGILFGDGTLSFNGAYWAAHPPEPDPIDRFALGERVSWDGPNGEWKAGIVRSVDVNVVAIATIEGRGGPYRVNIRDLRPNPLIESSDDVLRRTIRQALRTPGCGHVHTSFPDADVSEIISALVRAGFEIVKAP